MKTLGSLNEELKAARMERDRAMKRNAPKSTIDAMISWVSEVKQQIEAMTAVQS